MRRIHLAAIVASLSPFTAAVAQGVAPSGYNEQAPGSAYYVQGPTPGYDQPAPPMRGYAGSAPSQSPPGYDGSRPQPPPPDYRLGADDPAPSTGELRGPNYAEQPAHNHCAGVYGSDVGAAAVIGGVVGGVLGAIGGPPGVIAGSALGAMGGAAIAADSHHRADCPRRYVLHREMPPYSYAVPEYDGYHGAYVVPGHYEYYGGYVVPGHYEYYDGYVVPGHYEYYDGYVVPAYSEYYGGYFGHD
jgi:hypothetical protein